MTVSLYELSVIRNQDISHIVSHYVSITTYKVNLNLCLFVWTRLLNYHNGYCLRPLPWNAYAFWSCTASLPPDTSILGVPGCLSDNASKADIRQKIIKWTSYDGSGAVV